MKRSWHRLGVRPVDVDQAVALHRAGRLEEARRAYERILATDTRHVTALHFLGVLHHQTGRSDDGIAAIRRAIELDPEYVDALNNLGNILRETNQFDAAFDCYQRVVELMPSHADAWNNLGVMLRGRGQYDDAERAYARAIAINPSHAAAWQNRGSLHARLDQIDVAVAAYRTVLDLRPRDTAAYDALSRTLYRAGRTSEAIAVYHEWLEADPENAVATHMLAACTGGAAPARASDNYVRDTFDAFAGSFDQVLDQLGYRAPGLIGEFLDEVLPAKDATLIIADAGCGTGLCAPFLRPRARRLVGVDLSPGMLARARVRQAYDELIEAELTAWLEGHPGMFDLIVCADTLCYFGALDAPIAGAAAALRPGGRLFFTVEDGGEGRADYQLHPTGRYSHAPEYLRRTLTASALDLLAVRDVVLRRERGADVKGLLLHAERTR
jgi:predicted TPR repeat methyltransferase